MILTGNNCETITIESDVIDLVYADVAQYDEIIITIATDCGEPIEVTVATPFDDDKEDAYFDVDGNFILNPSILGETAFSDAVYTISISAIRTGGAGFDNDESCFFNDCTIACQVADYITLLIKDKPDMEIHMLHFALLEGSNCGCNCELLCEAWSKLQGLLAAGGLSASSSSPNCSSC